MKKDKKKGHYIAYGLLIGFIVGFVLDLYELTIFGAVGLGIVYGPMIGILLGAVYGTIQSVLLRNRNVAD